MAAGRTGSKSAAKRPVKPRPTGEIGTAPGPATGIPIPGVDPQAPGDKPRPEIPQWRRHRYAIHGMFGVVTAPDLLYTNPIQYNHGAPYDKIHVCQSLEDGLKVGRGKRKASVSYTVSIPESSPDMKVYCRGVCVTVKQDYWPPNKTSDPAFQPMQGVRLWDGTKEIAYEASPPKPYSSFLDQYIVSEWFFRKSPPSEPLAQSLTVQIAVDFTANEGTPLRFLEIRLVEVDIAMFGS